MSGVRTLEDALERVLYTGRRFNVSPILQITLALKGTQK